MIKKELFSILNECPYPMGCKDKESNYTFINRAYARLIGYSENDMDDLIGKTDAALPCKAGELASEYRFQDQLVLAKCEPIEVLNVNQFAGDVWKTLLVVKQPLFDSANKVIGIQFYVHDIFDKYYQIAGIISSQLSNGGVTKRKIDRMNKYHHSILTEKEKEYIYYILRGSSTTKKLSKIFDLTDSAVDKSIARLRRKFDVSSRKDLIKKATYYGLYDTSIPDALYKDSLSIII